MKPYEQFVGKMMQAVRDSQGKDPAAATGIIQQALRGAGLLNTPQAPAGDTAKPFVDLNAAPSWSRAAVDAADAAEPATQGMGGMQGMPGAARFAEWADSFQALRPQGKARTEHADPRAPGRFLEGVFTNDAGSRRYRLYVPSAPASGPRPLVVMLHGCKQDPEDFAAGTAMNALAEREGCLVLYPEQARSGNASHCWNWFEAGHQARGQGEPAILAGMTQEIVREHGADPARVFVAGLSAGGAMAAVMGAAYPELYRAVGVHSGLAAGSAHDLMSGLNAMKGAHGKGAHGKGARRAAGAKLGVPAIVIHGDRDAVVHPSNGDAVFRQATQGAALREVQEQGKGYIKTTALDGAGHARAEHWVLHGAGHAWAGGSPAGSYTDPSGPDASSAMLRFFLAQPPR